MSDAVKYFQTLTSFISECLDYFHEDAPSHDLEDRYRPLASLAGIVARLTNSAMQLTGEKDEVGAQVLARSAFEHAMTLEYSYLVADGLSRLNVTSVRERQQLFVSLAEWHRDPAYEKMAAMLPVPEGKGLPSVTDRLDRLDPDNVYMRSTYAVLSQATHVTTSSLQRHIERDGDQVRFNWDPQDTHLTNVTLGSLAFAMMAATWVFARIVNDVPMLDRLDEYSDRLRIPVRYDHDWEDRARAHLD